MNNLDWDIFKPFVKDLIAYYYDFPKNGAGGNLHIVLDDGNTSYGDIQFCMEACEQRGDTFGEFLCQVLFQFKESELQEMYKDGFWGMR